MSADNAEQDIVWPDEEHLFDVESSSINERAVSHTSDGWNDLDTGTQQARQSDNSQTADGAVDHSSANDFWDHDDRDPHASSLRC